MRLLGGRSSLIAVTCLLALYGGNVLSAQDANADAAAEAAAEAKARNYFTDLEVVDQNGQRHRFYSDIIKGKVVLINFVYTHCKDACPMATQKMSQIRTLLGESARDQVWFISISIDPENDTPGAMKAFMNKMQVDETHWLFLTGDKHNLETIVRRFGQYSSSVDDHSTLMLAGNDRKRQWTKVMPMTPPDGVAQQLFALIDDGPGLIAK